MHIYAWLRADTLSRPYCRPWLPQIRASAVKHTQVKGRRGLNPLQALREPVQLTLYALLSCIMAGHQH